jgi:hypothetical protein
MHNTKYIYTYMCIAEAEHRHVSVEVYSTRSPYVHCVPRRAQYGRCDFLRGTVGFIVSDKIFTIFYLFISIWGNMYALVQLINYQFCNLLLSFELKSHPYKPTVTSLQKYYSVLQVTSIWATSFTLLAYLTTNVQPSLSGKKFPLLLYFSSWVEVLLVFVCCPSLYGTLWALHVSHTSQGSTKQILLPCVRGSQGFRPKISGTNHSSLSLEISWMGVCSEIYEGWFRTAGKWGLAVVLQTT